MDDGGDGPASLATRRAVLAATAALAAAAMPRFASAADWTGPVASDADIDRMLPAISNWGRWGPDDQLGTLNFITPEMRLAAIRSVRTGRTVSLARERPVADATGIRKLTLPQPALHRPAARRGRHDRRDRHDLPRLRRHPPRRAMPPLHPRRPRRHVQRLPGLARHRRRSGEARRRGDGRDRHLGRGVLLDIAALKGGPLPLGSIITRADLEAAEARQGVTVGEGDILFVRNGRGPENSYHLSTGLHPECLPWLHARRVALLSHDGDGDVHPTQPGLSRWSEPVHMIAIPYLGMPLLCAADLEAVSAACAEEKRWSFFVTVAPWRFKGATSSPVNPLAIF